MAEGVMQQQEQQKSMDLATLVVPKSPVGFGVGTGLVATDAEGLWRIAGIVSKSRLVPRGIETQEAVFVAAAMGAEVGLSFMQSLQNIAVVNGRPTVWGDAALALVRSSGLCESYHEHVEGTGDALVAVATGRRRGETADQVERFSVEDAKRAGLWNKEGPWKQYPRRMLTMRARGFLLRNLWPDVLKGTITAEEAADTPTFAPTGPGTSFDVFDVPDEKPVQPAPAMPVAEAQSNTPSAETQKRHRATKAEMEARRAAEEKKTPPGPPQEPTEAPQKVAGPFAVGEVVTHDKHGAVVVLSWQDGPNGIQARVKGEPGSAFPDAEFYSYARQLKETTAHVASASAGSQPDSIECRGPNLGDRMTATYCKTQCTEAGQCPELANYLGATPAPAGLFG